MKASNKSTAKRVRVVNKTLARAKIIYSALRKSCWAATLTPKERTAFNRVLKLAAAAAGETYSSQDWNGDTFK